MKKKLLELHSLPPQLITPPLAMRAKSRREHAQRIVGILLIFAALLGTLITLVPEPTANAIVGTRVNVTQTETFICDFPLYPGWNVVSFNCVTSNDLRAPVLASTDLTKIKGMYEYHPERSDVWRVYAPNLPSYVVHDLEYLSLAKGYIVILYGAATADGVYYDGYLLDQTDMYLYAGFNLAGFPRENTTALPGALTTIQDTYEVIRTYNQSNGWIEYVNGSGGALVNLTSPEGYWVSVVADDIWTVTR